MAVTIKDVAALAGVSPSTVSRTCKDNPSISRETKEKVRRAIAELGYEPGIQPDSAGAFTKTIGIVLPPSDRDVYENAFYLEAVRGISQFCNQHKYINTIVTGQDDAELLESVRGMVVNNQADGFIVLYSKKDDPVVEYLYNEGVLYVIIGKAYRYANQTVYIDNDNVLAAQEATEYLIQHGHQKISYLGSDSILIFSADRKRGYQLALLNHDLPLREDYCVEIQSLQDCYEPLRQLLGRADRPTALLVSDDILALALECVCLELGLTIPKDLSIISFNNSLFARLTAPQLTSIDVNACQLGIEAASQMINHIENPNLLATKIIVPHHMIERDSCCPPQE